ncbi:MAG TPA: ATP-binding protein [Methylomirabilota bacterium]|nr:ATP-binding protein [Methylomirabilota bacterium]
MRYALAPLCVGAAVLVQVTLIGRVLAESQSVPLIHPTGLFQVCVVAAAWFGGRGPGLLAAVLATLALPRLIEMNYPLTAGFFDLPRFLAFAITGLAVGWGTTLWRRAEGAARRSEQALRQARDELEAKVREQTAELRRSEALLAEAETLSQTGGFGWTPATGAVVWSAGTFRIFEYDRTTTPTVERALQRVHRDDAPFVTDTVERAARDGKDFEHECRLVMPNGPVKHVHVVAHAGRDEAGRLEFVGAVMDVTARRRAEDAARKAQGELAHVARVMTMGELTASIAHEINQPLGAIVNDAQASLNWLAAPAPDLDKVRESVSSIMRDGNRAGDIIKRIRALVQKAETAKVPLDLDDTVREVLAFAEGEARRHRVTLRIELAGVPPVVADRVQLQQVLLNLVMNGVEAMSPVADRPRQLLVRARRGAPNEVLVAVQDTGVGIDRQDLDRIFDPFYTTKPQGMGMGLAICRSIVESHGGTLRAVPNDGPGTTFELTLPAA